MGRPHCFLFNCKKPGRWPMKIGFDPGRNIIGLYCDEHYAVVLGTRVGIPGVFPVKIADIIFEFKRLGSRQAVSHSPLKRDSGGSNPPSPARLIAE